MQSNEGLFSAVPADLAALLPVYSPKGATNVVAPPPKPVSKPAPVVIPNNWERFYTPVNDPSCGGEESIWHVASFLFGGKATEMTYLLKTGFKFPVFHQYIPMILEQIKVVGNAKFGQKFILEFGD